MPRRRCMPWRDSWGGTALKPRTWSKPAVKLPVMIVFVDTDEHVKPRAAHTEGNGAHRLIVRENVVLEQGNLE